MERAQTRGDTLNSIVLLRALAALAVVWTHLVATFTTNAGLGWMPLELVRKYINRPLGIDLDFANLGVTVFFLISGFIITQVAMRESQAEFAIKRILRIYPPLVVSVLLIVLAESLFFSAYGRSFDGNPLHSPDVVIRSVLLFNRLASASVAFVNPVTWTLVAEVLFYCLTFFFMPLIRRWPRLSLALELGLTILVCESPSRLPTVASLDLTTFSSFFASTQTALLLGQTLYLVRSRRIGFRFFALATLVFWVEQVHWTNTFNKGWYDAHPTLFSNLALAYCLFVVLLLLDSRIRVHPVLRFASMISYSLYLNHPVLGWLLLSVLLPIAGYPVSLLIALTVVTAVSFVSYLLVEAPSQGLARLMVKRLRREREYRAVVSAARR